MANNEVMKVLWVDNDPSVVEGTQQMAEQYNIDLPCFPNWEAAEVELKDHFNEFSAIILDANCEFSADSVEDKTFLAYVLPRLSKIFGEKHAEIPWYVLSAGTMDEFDLVLQMVNNDDRKKHNEDWGPLLYFKDKRYEDGSTDLDKLFLNIRQSDDNSYQTKIRAIYSDVFRTISEKNNKLDKEIENILMPTLIALHFPETRTEDASLSDFTQLRQVIEYLFRACNQTGLLPDECTLNGKINIQESLRYLSGENTKHLGVRYGSYERGDHLFPQIVSENLQQILNTANSCVHTADENPDESKNVVDYLDTVGGERQLYSFVLELCDVIVWYGKYVQKHPDREKNRRWCQSTKTGGNKDKGKPQPEKAKQGHGKPGFDKREHEHNRKDRDRNWQDRQKENIRIGDKGYYDIIPHEEENNTPVVTSEGISSEAYEHQMMCVERDGRGNWHCGKCLIIPRTPITEGERLEIYNIVANIKDSKDTYPLYAKKYNKLNF